MNSGKFSVFPGVTHPLGLTVQGDTSNFSVYSSNATKVFLGLFSLDNSMPIQEIPLNKTGDIWHAAVKGIPQDIDYAYRCEGPSDLKLGHLYNPDLWVSDPYDRAPDTSPLWNNPPDQRKKGYSRARILKIPSFDWQGDESPNIPKEDLIIYEMHVRGFTQHGSSSVAARGTYLGIIEKIPYLKKLGVNAIELMPMFEFNETHNKSIDPKTGQSLPNYWGYSTLHFFAPMRRFASSKKIDAPIQEFKTLVRELHRNGIEVILDVVYNHTGEDKIDDYVVNFRGLDNASYYMHDHQGVYKNYSGCGNTFNCNHPAGQQLILDSLRYWVEEMHVDGFRFDLASILTRDVNGHPLPDPPLILAMVADPIISKAKLIAEAWDAGGLYQIGFFPQLGPWSEWNGKYRDKIRRFIKGTDKHAGFFASSLSGSEPTYRMSKTPLSSINFVTAHDGYSLRDLVTYQDKHNLENGEMNQDGSNQNDNWNCGSEGPTNDKNIIDLRERQMRNFLLALFISQGIPMILMGDEYGHTRNGNNNPYVQDNEISWFLWDELEKNKQIFTFVSALITFRKKNPSLRHTRFLTPVDIDWHGAAPLHPDWSDGSRLVAFTLKSKPPIYAAFNAHFHHQTITLPPNTKWHKLVLTSEGWDQHFFLNPAKGPLLPAQIDLPPYSALLAQGI